jgi:DNA replication initiation complex subunit (GINS family)
MPDHYSQLLDWRRAEGAARGLAKLPHDFVPATQAYLAEARRVFESELRENPSGKKGELARQTFQRGSQLARDIVEARMTKLLSLAFQASVGGNHDVPNALPEERHLFDTVVEQLRSHRRTIAPYLEPTPSAPSSPKPAAAPAAPPSERTPTRPLPAVTVVRVLKDSRPVEVGGETLQLHKEDIVSLPPETAKILIEAKVAEKVERPEPPPTA